MKGIILSEGFHPNTQGGIQSFTRTLSEFYSPNLTIITKKTEEKKTYEKTNIIEVGSNSKIFRGVNKLLNKNLLEFLVVRKIKKLGAKIVVCNHSEDVKLIKNLDVIKILVQHTDFSKYPSMFCCPKENEEIVKKYLDYFIALCPQSKENFLNWLEFDKDKVKIIRHSSKIELLEEKKEKNKKLVMIARVENEIKRFDLVIKAMKKLPEFTLDIYGEEAREGEKAKLEKIMEENNISNVFFRGSTTKVQEKLDESGIFIMTSDFEGYPISTIEAMRRGLPIVLRNTFEAAEDIVIDNGVLLEKEWNEDKFVEAVRKVYDNYEYYSENSKKLGERHSPEVIKKEWDKLFND